MFNSKIRFCTNLLMLMLFAMTLQTCRDKDDSASLADYVWNYSLAHPDGFTLDLRVRQPVTKGIVAAYEATQNSFGKESLGKVISHALKHESIVGGWLDSADSSYYFDSSKVFPDGAYADAMAFAIENHQFAIYDLTHDSTTLVVYPSTSFNRTESYSPHFVMGYARIH